MEAAHPQPSEKVAGSWAQAARTLDTKFKPIQPPSDAPLPAGQLLAARHEDAFISSLVRLSSLRLLRVI